MFRTSNTYVTSIPALMWFTLASYSLHNSCMRLASLSASALTASFVERIYGSQLRDFGHIKFNYTYALSRLKLKTMHEGKNFAHLVTISCLKIILLDSIKTRLLVARLHFLDRTFCSLAFTNLALFGKALVRGTGRGIHYPSQWIVDRHRIT